MRPNALQAIVSLATGGKNDELDKLSNKNGLGVTNPTLQAALQRKMAKAAEDAAEEAADSILSIVKSAQDRIASKVSRIRELRRVEKTEKKAVMELNRAFDYGNETGNWIPLGILTGDIYEHHITAEVGKKASKIPADWTPKAPTETVVAE